MNKRVSFALLSFLLLVLIYSFTIKNEQTEKKSGHNTISGAELFLKNCASCHGKNLEGNPPVFPSLKDIGKRMDKEEIHTLLKTGRKAMPSFVHLSINERDAIIGYLLGKETYSSVVTQLSPIERGKYLFVANCATCHKVKPEDATPQGVRSYGMPPAILGGVDKRFSMEHFERILNTGPCYMPSFTYLSTTDKTNIYKYLSTFKDGYVRSNYRNCRCRMNY